MEYSHVLLGGVFVGFIVMIIGIIMITDSGISNISLGSIENGGSLFAGVGGAVMVASLWFIREAKKDSKKNNVTPIGPNRNSIIDNSLQNILPETKINTWVNPK